MAHSQQIYCVLTKCFKVPPDTISFQLLWKQQLFTNQRWLDSMVCYSLMKDIGLVGTVPNNFICKKALHTQTHTSSLKFVWVSSVKVQSMPLCISPEQSVNSAWLLLNPSAQSFYAVTVNEMFSWLLGGLVVWLVPVKENHFTICSVLSTSVCFNVSPISTLELV